MWMICYLSELSSLVECLSCFSFFTIINSGMKKKLTRFLYIPMISSDTSRNEAESKSFETCCYKLYWFILALANDEGSPWLHMLVSIPHLYKQNKKQTKNPANFVRIKWNDLTNFISQIFLYPIRCHFQGNVCGKYLYSRPFFQWGDLERMAFSPRWKIFLRK